MPDKKDQVKKLREEHPAGTLLEFEDDAWIFLKKPTRAQLGLAMTNARTNPLGLVDTLVRNCWAAGSLTIEQLISDDGIGYAMGISEKVDYIIGAKKGEVKN